MDTTRLAIAIAVLLVASVSPVLNAENRVNVTNVTRKCRDRTDVFDPDEFRSLACVMCYVYLFQHTKPLVKLIDENKLVFKNRSLARLHPEGFVPDPNDDLSMEFVAYTLSKQEEINWRQCCAAADRCCQMQLTLGDLPEHHCYSTWDGFSCWNDTQANTLVKGSCPQFFYTVSSSERSRKKCLGNATWETKDGLEWTDYTHCIDKKPYLAEGYISIICSSVSIILLLPSIIIFCCFKELFQQHRVKLHTNFFSALSLRCLAFILWFSLVHHDRVSNEDRKGTVMYLNPIWCRVLSFLKIYLTSCSFWWMFCEAFYLHRLITNAFQPPKSLLPIYLIGWVLPGTGCVTYAILRGLMMNERQKYPLLSITCWVWNFGNYEWIIYIPNLIGPVISLAFLCNILRILVFEIHSHPNEPSNFRRGLKAAFMLVPLFGLQMFLTIYRPPDGTTAATAYVYLYHINIASQGIFVSLIFCFFNSEVINLLRGKLCKRNTKPVLRQNGNGHSHCITSDTTVENKSPSLSSRSRTSLNQSPKHGIRVHINGTPSEFIGLKDYVREEPSCVALHFKSENNSATGPASKASYMKLSCDSREF